ncbi:MAG: hypothetical protein K0M50_03590 [Prolixibacteraceae bacterium]|nr:hypothetical protein [Prolixibacteraceae bacterium]
MLRVYKSISHDIYKAHNLIEYLVNEVWCKADKKQCKDKLNDELKALYEDQPWFQEQIIAIYKVCKSLTIQGKEDFKTAFAHNNRIEELCDGTITPIALNTLNKDLVKVVKPFFKELYTKFLGWKAIRETYGEKKTYYDELNLKNGFIDCPCCGYGDLKTIYSKGRSAFDHYLPQKHYPFSSTNFNNLVPICTTCNSDEKGEVDILKEGKPVYYPFAKTHPNIEVTVDVKSKALKKLIEPTNDLKSRITKSEIIVDFSVNDDKTESWDKIFDIKSRYFGKIANNRVGWFKSVDQQYKKYKGRINNYSVEDAFDDVIEDDSNEQLGFLKAPYLKSLKLNTHLVKAIGEVSGSSVIKD